MAYNKEAMVIILDIGPTVSVKDTSGRSFFDDCIQCLVMILQRKIFSESKDDVALILCGSTETNNPLSSDDEYLNVDLIRELAPVGWDFLDLVQTRIKPTSVSADVLDALVVAMDHLHTRTKNAKYAGRQLFFMSDFAGDFSTSQLDVVIKGLTSLQVRVNVIGPDLDCKSLKSETKGEAVVRKLLSEVDGQSFSFSEVLPAINSFKRKSIRTVGWKVNLEITKQLSIPVALYLKVKKATMKSWRKAYKLNKDMGLMTEQSYHRNDDGREPIDKSETIEAYRYGYSLVPFTAEDKANMDYRSGGKCLSVLGFTQSCNVRRHQLVGDSVHYVVADKNSEYARLALSSLVHALHETDYVAIVRYVYSASSSPKIGMLAPRIKAKYECLVFVQLPFAEDLRCYGFPSLKHKPTEEQLALVDELIDTMDLSKARSASGEVVELLKPKSILNPYVQRLYQCVLHRGLDPKCDLPDIQKDLLKQLLPDEEVFAACEPVAKKLRVSFPTERVVSWKEKKAAANFFKTKTEDQVKSEPDDDVGGLSELGRQVVTEVGTLNPVEDFATIVGSDPNVFEDASKQMQQVVVQLVTESFGELRCQENYDKAILCLQVLRRESTSRSPVKFNDFMGELKASLLSKDKRAFWEQMCREKVGLITREDSPESSDVSVEEGERYLSQEGQDGLYLSKDTKVCQETEDVDDLLDMM